MGNKWLLTLQPDLEGSSPHLRIVFAVTEVGQGAAAGDLFTAMELGAALEQHFGWQVDYRPQGKAWYALADVDVVIAMLDEYDPRCIQGAHAELVKVAWARNWFERWCEREWFADFDLHLASSQLGARYISAQRGKLARVLRIATNPDRFNIDHRPAAPSLDYVFTGSYWGAERDIVSALAALPETLHGAIYGKHWDSQPQLKPLYKGFVNYEDLPDVYRNADIVIDDANHVTKEWGAANSRVFDALAAGCLVITNSKSVSSEVFGGELPVYRSSEELVILLSQYIHDPASRIALQQRLRRHVLAEHTYAQRAGQFRLLLDWYRTKRMR